MSNESPPPPDCLIWGGGIFYSRKILASILGTWLEVEPDMSYYPMTLFQAIIWIFDRKLILNTCVVQIICVSQHSSPVHVAINLSLGQVRPISHLIRVCLKIQYWYFTMSG